MLATAPPDLCEHRFKLGRPLDIVGSQQCGSSFSQNLVTVVGMRMEGGNRVHEQQFQSLGSCRLKLQRVAVVRSCGSERLQRLRPFAGSAKCRPRLLDQRTRLAAEGPFQVESRREMVSEHLRVVRLAAERADPLRRS
jgi:hypothetical protein